jgi:hypothetical protein
MQVVNAVEGVTKLEVSKDGGATWGSTTRQTYNFFEYAAGYGSTVDIRVTGVSGSTVTVKNVAITPGSVVTASSNFGSSGSAVATSAVSKEVSTSSAQAATSSASSVAPVESSTTAVQATSTKAPVVVPTTSSSSSVVATSAAAPVITSAASSVSVPSSSSLSWAPKSTQSVVYVYEDGDECDA